MKIYIKLDENSRLQYWSSVQNEPDEYELEVNEEHEVLKNPFVYKYVDGSLVKDEEYQQQLLKEQEEIQNQPDVLTDLIFTLMMKGVI